jgi:hypothetical protein
MSTSLYRKFILLLACIVPSAFASGGPLKPRQPFKPTYDVIQSVDATAKTVTIGHANSKDTSTKTYKVAKDTDIQVNGAKGDLNDVKTGMKVSITLGIDEDVASRLVVSPAPPEPTPFPAPKRPPPRP